MATRRRLVPAPIRDVFDLLVDYTRYVEWAPDIVSSTVVAAEGDVVVGEFQSPFLTGEKYTLEFVHSKPASIVFKQVDQHGERGLRGGWDLTESGPERATIVDAALTLNTGVLRRRSNEARTARVLERRLDSLASMFAANGRRDAQKGVEKETFGSSVLRLVAAGATPQVRLLGTTFALKKIDG